MYLQTLFAKKIKFILQLLYTKIVIIQVSFLLERKLFLVYLVVVMDKLTVNQFAEKVTLTRGRIIQMIQSGMIKAEKIGDIYIIDQSYVQKVLSRPETRGRKRKIKTEAAA